MSGLRSSVDWGRASQGEGSPWSSVGPAHIISSPGGFLGSAGRKDRKSEARDLERGTVLQVVCGWR